MVCSRLYDLGSCASYTSTSYRATLWDIEDAGREVGACHRMDERGKRVDWEYSFKYVSLFLTHAALKSRSS